MNPNPGNRYIARSQSIPVSLGTLCYGEDLALNREVILYTVENRVRSSEDDFVQRLRKASSFAKEGFLHILDTSFSAFSTQVIFQRKTGIPLIHDFDQKRWSFAQTISMVSELAGRMLEATEDGVAGFSVEADNLWLSDEGKLSVINYWDEAAHHKTGAPGLCGLLLQLLTGSPRIPQPFEALDEPGKRLMRLNAPEDQKLTLIRWIERSYQDQATLASLAAGLRELQSPGSIGFRRSDPLQGTNPERPFVPEPPIRKERPEPEYHERTERTERYDRHKPYDYEADLNEPSDPYEMPPRVGRTDRAEHAERPEKTAAYETYEKSSSPAFPDDLSFPDRRRDRPRDESIKAADSYIRRSAVDDDDDEEDEDTGSSPVKKIVITVSIVIVAVFLIWLFWPRHSAEPKLPAGTTAPSGAPSASAKTTEAGTAASPSPADESAEPTPSGESGAASQQEGAPVSAPNLTGMSLDDAAKQALAFGLHYQYFLERNAAEKDQVFKQEPAAGTDMKVGDQITIYVSKGME